MSRASNSHRWERTPFAAAVLLFASWTTPVSSAAEKLPYVDDREIVAQLRALKPGQSLLLPPVKHFAAGEPIVAIGRNSPYSRDYTNKMAYASERESALYSGGNHGFGRMAYARENRVAAFDVKSNTWTYITPDGPGIPQAQYGSGKVYYDPTHNLLVVQAGTANRFWVYRRAAARK